MVMLSLDISKAYNCVHIVKLGQILCILTSLLHIHLKFLPRNILVMDSDRAETNERFPQGSCLSSTLFNLYTAKLRIIEGSKTAVCW